MVHYGGMNIGELASRVARRHCTHEHQGATPCVFCAELRYMVIEAIGEFLGELTREVHRNVSSEPEH